MKRIINFVKEHIFTLIIFCVCLYIYLSYQNDLYKPKIITKTDFIYGLFSELSLAYMGSFIVYIVISYIPDLKRRNKLKISIKRNIHMILQNMKQPLNYMANDLEYRRDENKIDVDTLDINEFRKIFNDFCCYELSPMVDDHGEHVINIRYINYFINESNVYIDRLYNLMIMDLDFELIEILDKIRSSIFHNRYLSMAEANTPRAVDKSEVDVLYEYYSLYKELKHYYDSLE